MVLLSAQASDGQQTRHAFVLFFELGLGLPCFSTAVVSALAPMPVLVSAFSRKPWAWRYPCAHEQRGNHSLLTRALGTFSAASMAACLRSRGLRDRGSLLPDHYALLVEWKAL